jgi:amidase
MPKPSDIVMMDALALSRAIQSKQVSCVEVMNAYLDHIDALNPKVNAIISLQDRGGLIAEAKARDEQLSRGEVCGWMHGLPRRSRT